MSESDGPLSPPVRKAKAPAKSRAKSPYRTRSSRTPVVSSLSPAAKPPRAPTDRVLTFLQSARDRDEPVRFGKWSAAEDAYLGRLVTLFQQGLLAAVPPKTSLRAWLAHMLQCCPMRISKKQLHGRSFEGKSKFRRNAAKVERLDQQRYEQLSLELAALRIEFLQAWAKEELARRDVAGVVTTGFRDWYERVLALVPTPEIARNERLKEVKKRAPVESISEIRKEVERSKRHRTNREGKEEPKQQPDEEMQVSCADRSSEAALAIATIASSPTAGMLTPSPIPLSPVTADFVAATIISATTLAPAPITAVSTLTPAPITSLTATLTPAPITAGPATTTLSPAIIPPNAAAISLNPATVAASPAAAAAQSCFGDSAILGDWLLTPSRSFTTQWNDMQTVTHVGESCYSIREDAVQLSVHLGDQQNSTGLSMTRRSSRLLIDFGAPSCWITGEEPKRLCMPDCSQWSDHDLVDDLAMLTEPGLLGWDDSTLSNHMTYNPTLNQQ